LHRLSCGLVVQRDGLPEERIEMNTKVQFLHLLIPALRPREDRIAPARSVRLMHARHGVPLYDEARWGGLPPRIANAYARFEDKCRLAMCERFF
jgi:hypothetical protein